MALLDSVFRFSGHSAFVEFFRKDSDYFFQCWKVLQAKYHAAETLKASEGPLFVLDILIDILKRDFETAEGKDCILVKEFLGSFKQAAYLMTVVLDLTLKKETKAADMVDLLDQLMIKSESRYNDKMIDSLSAVLHPLTDEKRNDFFMLLPPSIFKQIVIEDRLLQICFIHRSNKKLLPLPFSAHKLRQVYMDPTAMKNNPSEYWPLIVSAISTEIHLGHLSEQEKQELKEALALLSSKQNVTDVQPLMDLAHKLLSL